MTAKSSATAGYSSGTPMAWGRLQGLDGIRALAAIAVLLYHTWPTMLPGGFLGVDVFFVLSGFLITGLLLKEETSSGKIQLRAFWLRRFRRLFPAVFLVTTVSIPLGALAEFDLITNIRTQLATALTFTYNWGLIIDGTSYFDRGSPRLLTHMWTLAVEQQFYLFWPVVIGFLLLIFKKHVFLPLALSCLGLAAISAALMQFYQSTSLDPSRAYLGTDSHAFGLMIGASLACFYGAATFETSQSNLDKVVKKFADSASNQQKLQTLLAKTLRFRANALGVSALFSLFGIAVIFIKVDERSSLVYPELALLCSILTSLLIQISLPRFQIRGTACYFLTQFLELKVLRWLGEHSYGIYLWHWPVFLILQAQFPELNAPGLTLLVAIGSIFLSTLSFSLVETPMRLNGIIPVLRHWWSGIVPDTPSPRTSSIKNGKKTSGLVLIIRKSSFAVITGLIGIGLVVPSYYSQSHSQVEVALLKAAQASKQSTQTGGKDLPQQAVQSDSKPSSETKPAEDSDKKPTIKLDQELRGNNITIIGDSVTAMVTPLIQNTWPGIDCDGLKNRNSDAVLKLLEERVNRSQLGYYVVVSTATNGSSNINQIDSWVKMIGPQRKLILVTAFGPQREHWIWQGNQAFKEAVKKYPNQVVIGPWDELIQSHIDTLYRDRTHPRPSGEKYYLQALEVGLKRAQSLK